MDAIGIHTIRADRLDDRFGAWTTRVLTLLLFSLLGLAMTYPLVLNMRSRVPGPPGDNFAWLYHMWWLRRGVIELGTWPTINPGIYYPFGSRLPLSDLMLANQVLVAPFLLLGDEVLGYNALLLLSFVLTGYTTYLLIAYLTDNRYAAVVGGAVFAFCPYRIHAMTAGWLPLVSTQWIPLVFLYLERTLREHKARYALSAGLFLIVNSLASWQYGYIVGALAIMYVLIRVRPWRAFFRHTHLARNLALTGAVAFTVIVPIAWERAVIGSESVAWVPTEEKAWVPSLEDYFLPSVYHPAWELGLLKRGEIATQQPWDAPGYAYLGAGAMLLAIVGLFTGPRTGRVRRAYFWIGAISLALALGAFLHWKGQVVGVALPPNLAVRLRRAILPLWDEWTLHRGAPTDLPLGSNMVPIPLLGLLMYLYAPLGTAISTLRGFGVVVAFVVSVLAGMGAAQILGGRSAPEDTSALEEYVEDAEPPSHRQAAPVTLLLTPILLGMVLFDAFSAPLAFGTSQVGIQPLDLWLAGQPEEIVVMQLPLKRALAGISLYRAKYHGKRIAYGHGRLMPDRFYHAMPTLASFPGEESLSLLRSWGVTHVVVASRAYDEGWGDAPGMFWEEMRAHIEASPQLHLMGVTPEDPIWRYEPSPRARLDGPLRAFTRDDKVYVYELR